MGAVLQDFPRYEWGWCQLLAWVEADQDWSRGKELLATWPGALMDLADLRARRLAVLAAAGIPPSELDAQWDELLQDFPQDLGVHLRRFESLWDRDNTPRAAALLAALERYHPAAPTLLARKVMVCMRQVEPEAAVRTAVAVWTHPDDSDRWASLSAWDTVSKAGWADAATEAISEALRQNYRVQLPALGRMLDRLATEGRKAKGKRLRGAVLLRLRGILVSLDRAPWDAAAHRAMVLKAMAGAGFFPEALGYWRENQDTLARQTVVWQEIGHILTDHRPNEAVAFLAPWRDMPGVEMFIVANYAYVLRTVHRQPGERLDLLRRLLASSRDALATLHHDHTARFLACCYCEAALRLGLQVEFLAAMDAYHAYLEMPAEQAGNAYMPDDYAFAPAVLSRFACLLREASADAVRVKALYLEAAAYAAHDRAHPAWVAATLYRCLRQHSAAGPLLRLRARVGALFSI
jgi:hypothetical protein